MLLVLVAVLLAACSNAPVSPPPPPAVPTPQKQPTQLVVGVSDLPPGFNPHLLADLSPVTTGIATLVLPSVFRVDAAGNPQLDTTIATKATVTSQNPFTVSYELNVQAAWSDNAPIAAEDFQYLWEQMRSQPGVADAAGYRLITDVRSRAGGKAVDVVFAHPYPAWKRLFSGLLPAHLIKDVPGSWTGATAGGLPASGGPFKVVSVDRARGEILLARNDLYWSTPTVLDQLVLRRLPAVALQAGFETGDVNLAIPDADVETRQALARIVPAPHVQPAPQPVVTELGFRADGGPLADFVVRRAMGAIIDPEAVRAEVAPEALPAAALALGPSEPGYAPTAPPTVKPDPALAAQLLTSVGWRRDPATGHWDTPNGKPVRLVLAAAAERTQDQRVAEVVAKQLQGA